MGVGHSCRCSSNPPRTPNEDPNGRNRGRKTSSPFQFAMPSCLRHNNGAKQTEKTSEKKHQYQLLKDASKETTLMEWILSSPVSDNHGNDHVAKLVSNKVHPSVGDYSTGYGSDHRRSLSGQRLLKFNEVKSGEVDGFSSLNRSRRGKSEKRVSFRLPEEADIFVYSPPEEEDVFELTAETKIDHSEVKI